MVILLCVTWVLAIASGISFLVLLVWYQIEVGNFKNFLTQKEKEKIEESREVLKELGDWIVVTLFVFWGSIILILIFGLLNSLG